MTAPRPFWWPRGDLCDCDRMLVECPGGYENCIDYEEWGQEYDGQDWPDDDTPSPADADRCCYEPGGPDACYCAERDADDESLVDRRPIETITTTGDRL